MTEALHSTYIVQKLWIQNKKGYLAYSAVSEEKGASTINLVSEVDCFPKN